MMEKEVEEFLSHYGKKGMKWGVRKGRSKTPGTRGYSKDAKTSVRIHRKAKASPVKVKALSNKEIEIFLKRVNLETRYREVTPSTSKKVMRVVKDLLGMGKTVNEAFAFSNSPSGKAIQTSLKKKPKAK